MRACSRVRQRARIPWGWALGRRGSEKRLAGRSGEAWKSGEEKIGHGDPVSCTHAGNRNVACQAESKQCGIVVGQRFGPTCDCSAAEQRDCRRFPRPNLVARQFQGRRSCHIFASTLLHAPTPAYTSRDKNLRAVISQGSASEAPHAPEIFPANEISVSLSGSREGTLRDLDMTVNFILPLGYLRGAGQKFGQRVILSNEAVIRVQATRALHHPESPKRRAEPLEQPTPRQFCIARHQDKLKQELQRRGWHQVRIFTSPLSSRHSSSA